MFYKRETALYFTDTPRGEKLFIDHNDSLVGDDFNVV
jgi:hypothetical protein